MVGNGPSPSGKAPGFGPGIRGFESLRPSQIRNYHKGCMGRFTYIDLFAGIGGFRIATENNGGESVGFSEIDKPAIETYVANFGCSPDENLGDITKMFSSPRADLVMGGVPCQSWSVAGKRRGFDDPRGKLWYDSIRVVGMAKPKVFIFENVKGLADPRNKANLDLIIDSLSALGYTVRYKLLNSFDYGVPQNRTRIFIVGFRNDLKKYADKFEWPVASGIGKRTLADSLDGVTKKVITKKKIMNDPTLNIPKAGAGNAFQRDGELNDFFTFCDTRNGHSTIHSWDLIETTGREKEICLAILRNRRKKRYGPHDGNPLSLEDLQALVEDLKVSELKVLIKKNIIKMSKDQPGKYVLVNSKNSAGINGIYRVYLPNSPIFSTLTATGTNDYVATEYVEGSTPEEFRKNFIEQVVKPGNIRKITPDEARRIQGFPDGFQSHSNELSAFKQYGNAVSPPVVEHLISAIIETGVFMAEDSLAESVVNYDFLPDAVRMPTQTTLLT